MASSVLVTHPPPHLTMADDHDEMAYLPGSGPSLDAPYGFPTPSANPGFVTAFWNPYEVKHRRRTSRAQLTVLETEFETDPKPNADKRRALAAQLNMTPRAIQVWFQNRRAKIKAIKNKIPGGRGMPKLKPAERAAARAARAAAAARPPSESDDEDEEKSGMSMGLGTGQWIQLESTPLSSPTHPSPSFGSESARIMSPASDACTPPASAPKPQFTIAVPPPDGVSGPNSAHSSPPSPDFPAPQASQPSSDFLAPPSPQAMLRRGSAPAPLQGIHRARYSAFSPANAVHRSNEVELAIPPASPISPPDHEVAPLRRGSLANLARRPSLPDSHLRLQSHPYYPHSHQHDRSGSGPGPRMQRRSGLLSPVPDVGHEQEQGSPGVPHVPYSLSIPTVFPPAPQPSRMYRALPPGMGATPAAHDLPTQFPARPTLHAPARPFAVPVLAGPLPAADFSFGAPEPGHGDAFNRAMEGQEVDIRSNSNEFNSSNSDFQSSNPDFHSSNSDFQNTINANDYSSSSPNTEFNPPSATSEFAPPAPGLWDARTRFGSMASIASDVTGVSVSSTQATSVSGGLGTAGCDNGYGDARFGDGYRNGFGYGYPVGFQPDVRRASCPGEFLHQFSGMGMNNSEPGSRSTSMNMRPSPLGRSLTIAPDVSDGNHRGLTLSPEGHRSVGENHHRPANLNLEVHRPTGLNLDGHRSGMNLALKAKTLCSPTFPSGQVDPTYPPPPPNQGLSEHGPFGAQDQQQQHASPEMYQSPQGNMTPAQRALVGGGFGGDAYIGNGGGYVDEMRTPPDGSVEVMHHGGMNSSGQASPMLFAGVGVEGVPAYDISTMNPDSIAMAMIGHEYAMPVTSEFAFP